MAELALPAGSSEGRANATARGYQSAVNDPVRLRAENTPPRAPRRPLFGWLLSCQRSTHRHTGACCLFLRSLARSLSSAAHTDILVPVSQLARSLALRSLARSLLARSLALRSLLARSLTATHRRTGVTVRHGMLRTARSLASSPLDRLLSARSLARQYRKRHAICYPNKSNNPIKLG